VDGVVRDLLREAAAAGLRVSVEGETLRIRGPKAGAPIAEQLAAHKPAVLALLTSEREQAIRHRIDAFRAQVPERVAIPFLVLTATIAPRACPSCGESIGVQERLRCALCAEAARRVLAEHEAGCRQRGGVP
jgi:hypothetical protein